MSAAVEKNERLTSTINSSLTKALWNTPEDVGDNDKTQPLIMEIEEIN